MCVMWHDSVNIKFRCALFWLFRSFFWFKDAGLFMLHTKKLNGNLDFPCV